MVWWAANFPCKIRQNCGGGSVLCVLLISEEISSMERQHKSSFRAARTYFIFLLAAGLYAGGQTVSPTPPACLAQPGSFCSGGATLVCPIGAYCAGNLSLPVTIAPAWQQVGSGPSHSGAQALAATFRNGTLLWAKPIASVQGRVVVSANTTVFVAGGSVLYAVDGYTNHTLWTFGAASTIAAGPVLGTNGETVFFTTSAGLLFALNSTSGVPLVNVSSGSVTALSIGPVRGVDYLFALRASPPLLRAYNCSNLTSHVWSFSGIGTAFTTAPVSIHVNGGLVFQGGSDVIGNPGNRLYALNATNGQTVWVVATSYPACAVTGFSSNGYSMDKVIVGLSSHLAFRQLRLSSGATINTNSVLDSRAINCGSFTTLRSTGIVVAAGIAGSGAVFYLNNSGTSMRQTWNFTGTGSLLGSVASLEVGISPVFVFLDALGKLYFVNGTTGGLLGIFDSKRASSGEVSVSYDGIVYFTASGFLYAMRGFACPAGFYCFSGLPILCPAGSFCPLGSLQATLCPKGSFSAAAGAINCSLCPAGTFSSVAGSTSCQNCPGGHFCPTGTSSWAFLHCGAGNYCPDGSGAPTPCPNQVPPSGGWGALQVQGPAFVVETAHCLNHCFWNFTSGDGVLSKC